MSYFIHLSLLLAIITISAPGLCSDKVTNLPLLNCARKNISCKNDKDVWQIHYYLDSANVKLSLSCTGKEPSSNKCLKITLGNDQMLCKKCCKNEESNDKCDSKCEESRTITMTGTNETLSVKFESDCEIEITDETVVPLKFFDEKKSWIKALQHCHNLSYSLVHITNQTVQEEVKNLMQCLSKLKAGVWVGLERSIFGTDLEWKWTSGSTAVNPVWIENFPADSLNNHCGKIIWHNESKTIKLLDANCHDELPFICQENLYMEF